jgi:hypothetical protein
MSDGSYTRLIAASFNPSGWPIIEADYLVAFIRNVLVIRLEPSLSETTHRQQMAAVARALDAAPDGFRYSVLVHAEKTLTLDARRRRELAEYIQQRLARPTHTCVAEVLVTQSVVVHGIAQVLGWLAPRTVPFRSATTPEQGFQIMSEYVMGLDAAMCAREYARLARLQPRGSAQVR